MTFHHTASGLFLHYVMFWVAYNYIDEIFLDIDTQLKKMFGKKFLAKLLSVEVNITEKMFGKCTCENIFRLFNNALLHKSDQNMIYVVQSDQYSFMPLINGIVTRTVKSQWKLKCYDKMSQLGIETNEKYIRIEFILMARKITSIFNNREIKNVLSRCGIELLLNSFKFLYTNLIDNYVKEYLTDVHKALIDELKRTNSPVDIYCKFKEVIVDKEQMRKALKAWYKEKCTDEWHTSDYDCELHEFLGLTEEEYDIWFENDSFLDLIIDARELRIPIVEYLQKISEYQMAARASSPEVAQKIKEWLIKSGRLNNGCSDSKSQKNSKKFN